MSTEATDVCPHCGLPETEETEHRGCRLKAAFPGAYHEDGVMVAFDMEAIRKAIGWHKPIETQSGMKFERMGGHVWIHVGTQIGNVLSSWSWRISDDEWDRAVEAITVARRDAARLDDLRAHETDRLASTSREAGVPATDAVERGTTGAAPATRVATPLGPSSPDKP